MVPGQACRLDVLPSESRTPRSPSPRAESLGLCQALIRRSALSRCLDSSLGVNTARLQTTGIRSSF